jgi:hypothetical protein
MNKDVLFLATLGQCDSQAAEKLLRLICMELRWLMIIKMAWEESGRTLEAMALLHGTRQLFGRDRKTKSEDQVHLFSAVTEPMCRILNRINRKK